MIDTTKQIKILLADDEPAVLAGMQSWLANETDIQVVKTAKEHDEVVHLVKTMRPDVIVLDIRMPGKHFDAKKSVETLRKDIEGEYQPKIIMYSGHWGREFIDHYLELGATGFLAKADGHDQIVDAIRTVTEDEVYYGRNVQKHIYPPKQPKPFKKLTNREHEVLRRIAGGHSNAEIAQSLHITEGTVKVHVSNILSKLYISTRLKLAIIALRNGIEPYDPPELVHDFI